MGKLKDVFFKINSKVPVIQVLFYAALMVCAYASYCLIDVFKFEPDFMVLYGLEDASAVRARVEEQMRRYKAKPPPPPQPAPQMSYEVRILRQHNIYLPPGVIEPGVEKDETQKITDIQGIDLVGTVYSYTKERRSALIELNGVALVVLEGKFIRGTQKKVTEIGRSRITIQESGLLPATVHLAHEYGLDDLSRALAANEYKTKSNWDYEARSSGGKKVKPEGEEGGEEDKSGDVTGGKAEKGGKKHGKKKSADDAAATAEEDAAAEEEEAAADEEAAAEEDAGAASSGKSSGGGGGGGVDIGGGE